MVLKRKLPTQESKLNKKSEVKEQESKTEDQFDMSLDTDSSEKLNKKETVEGHDFNYDMPNEAEEKPEDFIPEELKAMEYAANAASEEHFENNEVKEPTKKQKEEQKEQENEDIAPVSFDEKDDFEITLDDEPAPEDKFANKDAEPAELPGNFEQFANLDDKDDAPSETEDAIAKEVEKTEKNMTNEAPQESMDDDFATIDFATTEEANWNEIAGESKQEYSNEDDGFESISWDDTDTTNNTEDKTSTAKEEQNIDDIFDNDNGGIVPEIPGMSFASKEDDKPAEFLGQNNKDMSMSSSAKGKLIGAIVVSVLAIGGILVFANGGDDSTKPKADKWANTVKNKDNSDKENKDDKSNNDVTELTTTENQTAETKSIIDFTDTLDNEDSLSDEFTNENVDFENDETDAETAINLLEPKVVEKTKSGKEIIKADGTEEMPEDIEEGANLISNITAELERQKAKKAGEKEEKKSKSDVTDSDGNAADINKKVDEQLAEYRKLLAAEEDPGKKVKPGKFFSGEYSEDGSAPTARSANVARVDLNKTGNNIPEDYARTSQAVDGHQIVEYPEGVARKPDDGIRQLDHFRNLLVEKEDDRVRIPKNVRPGLRNQGFPAFKVVSIVPNYGLFGEYNGKKGVLIIGDMFKGWELVGVYDSYAEFQKENRKHIISLK